MLYIDYFVFSNGTHETTRAPTLSPVIGWLEEPRPSECHTALSFWLGAEAEKI